MKSFNTRLLAGTAVLVALFSVSQLSAATNPLNAPRGLALASNGNLYVANTNGNNILVFNPNYAFVSSKTITTGISKPSGVAFDTSGNLYVSNQGSQSVTMYNSAGLQNTAGTITQSINTPEGIAVDGLDNVYVDNGYTNVTVYSAAVYPTASPVQVTTFTPNADVFSIATHGASFAWGGVSLVTVQYTDQILSGASLGGFLGVAEEGLTVAFDGTGNLYVGNATNTVSFLDFGTGSESQFAALSFSPEGIAVDSARGRVYISDQNGNAIYVYSTAGALLKVIQ